LVPQRIASVLPNWGGAHPTSCCPPPIPPWNRLPEMPSTTGWHQPLPALDRHVLPWLPQVNSSGVDEDLGRSERFGGFSCQLGSPSTRLTSQVTYAAFPPAASASETASSNSLASDSSAAWTTSAPSSAKYKAMARPIPELAPVTSATLPSN